MPSDSKNYSIQALVKATNISAVSLRNWEKRYGILKPLRSQTGQRVYSSADLETVRKIAALLKSGAKIGDVSRSLKAGEALPDLVQYSGENSIEHYLKRLVRTLERFQSDEANFIASVMALSLTAEGMILKVYVPLVLWVREEQKRETMSVALAGFVTSFVRHRLHPIASLAPHHMSRHVFVLATLREERNEDGLMILNCLLKLRGHSTIFLGCGIPIQELFKIDVSMKISAIYLSFTNVKLSPKALLKLKGFRSTLILGGSGVATLASQRAIHGIYIMQPRADDLVERIEEIVEMVER